MLEQIIRHHYQRYLVDTVARILHTTLIPLHITALALIAGILVIPALMYHFTYTAVALLLLSGYLDTLDGTIARHTNTATPFGSICDIMTDRAVEFSAIFGIWLVAPVDRALMCILMLGSILFCITSFLVVGIFTPNDSMKGFHYSPGLIERAEAFIFFICMILLPDQFTFLSGLFIILVSLTTVVRLYEFKKYDTI